MAGGVPPPPPPRPPPPPPPPPPGGPPPPPPPPPRGAGPPPPGVTCGRAAAGRRWPPARTVGADGQGAEGNSASACSLARSCKRRCHRWLVRRDAIPAAAPTAAAAANGNPSRAAPKATAL